MNHLRSNDGFVSLVAVTIASFLILILTLGMASLMVGELRQAEDNENQVRAYYSAESDAEAQVLYIKSLLAIGNVTALAALEKSCPVPASFTPNGQVTDCEVSAHGYPYNGSINSQNLEFGFATALNSLGVQTNPSSFQLAITWPSSGSSQQPPYIEAVVDSFTRSASGVVSSATTTSSTLVICPTATSSTCQGAKGSSNTFFSPPGGNATLYGNTVTLNVGAAPWKTGVLQLRMIGGSGSISLTPLDNKGNPLDIRFPNATIDITAKSGDSFSRVQEVTPLTDAGTQGVDVLRGDQGLCKTFKVLSVGTTALGTVEGSDTCP